MKDSARLSSKSFTYYQQVLDSDPVAAARLSFDLVKRIAGKALQN